MRKIGIIIALFAALATQYASGAIEKVVSGLYGTAIDGGIVTVQDHKFVFMQSNSGTYTSEFEVKESRVRARLWFDDSDRDYFSGPWTLKVNYDIELEDPLSAGVDLRQGESLTINWDPASGYADIDMKDYLGFLKAQAINITVDPGSTLSPVPDDVHFDLQVITERYYVLDFVEKPVVYKDFDAGKNELQLAWSFVEGAESYDVDWVFIDIADGSEQAPYEIDWKNSTRVNVSGNSYNVSLAYPRGIIVYRVRGIGLAGTGFQDRREGAWSYDPPVGTTTDQVVAQGPAPNNQVYKFVWDGLELDRNWQYDASHKSGGKRREVIRFFDGSMRDRQMVSIMNTDQNANVSQKIYDFIGRPSVQVMPAPISSQGIRLYNALSLSASSASGVFDYTNYDTDLKVDNPDPIATNSVGAGSYFSSTGPGSGINGGYTPDAEGYPYSRIRYKNDGTARGSHQNGPGADFKAGSGHGIQTFYGAPTSQAELDRLFGNEVGFVSQYKKSMVVDPNGQAHIRYFDQDGHLIATSLGGSTISLVDLDTKPTQWEMETADLTAFNSVSVDGSELSLSNTFLVPGSNITYTFTYQLDPAQYANCLPAQDCIYDLIIRLEDECGVVINNHDYLFEDILSSDQSQIPGSNGNGEFIFAEALNTGSYTIHKILRVNPASLDQYRDLFIDQHDDIPCFTIPQPPLITTCNPTCADLCAENFVFVDNDGNTVYQDDNGNILAMVDSQGGFIQGNQGAVNSVTGNNGLIDQCLASCGETPPVVPNECQIKETLMREDLAPGGQYFDNLPERFDANYNINGWLEDPINGMDLQGFLSILNGAGVVTTNWGWTEVRDNWDPTWPQAAFDVLFNRHPEFCVFSFYCTQEPSGNCTVTAPDAFYDYMNTMYTPGYDQPNSANFIDYYNNSGNNPNSNEELFNPLNLASQNNDNQPGYQPFNGTSGVEDPLFVCNPNIGAHVLQSSTQYTIADLMLNMVEIDGTTYSIWYLIEDPDNVAGANGGNGNVDPLLFDLMNSLHGDGNLIAGAIGTGPNQMTEYTFFRATYQFLRDLAQYKHYQDVIAQGAGCGPLLNSPANDGLTSDGFAIFYPENPVFDAFDGNIFTTLNTFGGTTCVSACQQAAEAQVDDLIAQGCIVGLSKLQVQQLEADLVTICTYGCDEDYPSGNSQGDPDQVLNIIYPNFGAAFTADDVVNYYSTVLCTTCPAGCDPIVYPAPAFDQEACQCQELEDFIVSYYNQLSPAITGVTDLSAVTDQADFMSVLEDLFTTNDDAMGYTFNDVQTWLSNCQSSTANGSNIAELFQCGTSNNPNLGSDPVADFLNDCVDELNALAQYNYEQLYSQVLQQRTLEYVDGYVAACFDNIENRETFTMEYEHQEFHYTLFYYDQMNSVIKTIPPSGVYQVDLSQQPPVVIHNSQITDASTLAQIEAYRIDPTNNPGPIHPNHVIPSNYRYDSHLQLISSESPDGGQKSRFYDNLERLSVSQNAKQLLSGEYSYVLYDELGRTIETGEIGSVPTITEAIVKDAVAFDQWMNTSGAYRKEVTQSFYDQSISNQIAASFGSQAPQYLRTRVSSVTYEETYDGNDLTYDQASHFSYDQHGSVVVVLQENTSLAAIGQSFKRIEYEYDLVTSLIKQISYQPGKYDEFYHRYCYDSDNRVTHTFTSRDGQIWEKDQKVFFYAHGPKARVEVGDYQVQASDFAYTIQGWKKMVNSSTSQAATDIGNDSENATLNEVFARDASGFSLDYFAGDFKPINNGVAEVDKLGSSYLTATPDLYNGNLRGSIVTLSDRNEQYLTTHARSYRHDQLNRVKGMDVFKDDGNNDPVMTNSLLNAINNGDYATSYQFDGNGNLSSLTRNAFGVNQNMDAFGYNYDGNANGAPNFAHVKISNLLRHVEDAAPITPFADIKPGQMTASGPNYEYDEIGELVKDRQECISNIDWDHRKRILRVERNLGCYQNTDNLGNPIYPSELEYHYDGNGSRLLKIEKPQNPSGIVDQSDWIYTYYVRDVAGECLAIYERTFQNDENGGPNDFVDRLELKESHIYGAGRVGIANRETEVSANFTATLIPDPSGASYAVFEQNTITYLNIPFDGAGHQVAPDEEIYGRLLGDKAYELKNHINNVSQVVTDRHVIEDLDNDQVIDNYTADVVLTKDYYPYGMSMPGRSDIVEDYRFDFNGMETDGEWGIQDYGERMYNGRVGRFLSVDPLAAEYAHLTPYQFASNMPLTFIDLDGLEKAEVPDDAQVKLHMANDQDVLAAKMESAIARSSDVKMGTLKSQVANDIQAVASQGIPQGYFERSYGRFEQGPNGERYFYVTNVKVTMRLDEGTKVETGRNDLTLTYKSSSEVSETRSSEFAIEKSGEVNATGIGVNLGIIKFTAGGKATYKTTQKDVVSETRKKVLTTGATHKLQHQQVQANASVKIEVSTYRADVTNITMDQTDKIYMTKVSGPCLSPECANRYGGMYYGVHQTEFSDPIYESGVPIGDMQKASPIQLEQVGETVKTGVYHKQVTYGTYQPENIPD